MTSGDARLPALNPDVAAAILQSATPRIDRKATSLMESRGDWTVDAGTVTIGTARVTVVDGAASCDCLLAPKCAHLLAVARMAPVADVSGTSSGQPSSESPTSRLSGGQAEATTLTDAQRSAAATAAGVLGDILRSGLREITTVQRGAVLRAVHACRVAGLHKLGAEVTALHAVVTEPSQRDVATLRTALLAAHRLVVADEAGDVGPEVIGVARRAFDTVGTLRLRGLACEPIVTDSGYSGVTTYFADSDGAGYELGSVLPGGADGVAAAYRRPGGLGEFAATPAELARTGVLVAGATVSADGRLGRGKSVRAKALTEADGGARWAGSLPEGWTRSAGTVAADEGGLTVGGVPLVWSVGARRLGEIAPPFADGDDCVVLSRDGVAMAVEYVAPDGDRKVWLPGLDHPVAARRSSNVGDLLAQDDFPADERGPTAVLRRWVERVGRHGAGVLERDRVSLAKDAAWLAEHGSPYRAELLSGLDGATRSELTKAWLKAAVAGE